MKRKHITLTLEQKYMVIKDVENGMSHSKIACKYNIGKSTVRDIKRKENEIRTKIIEGGISTRKRKTLKASTFKKTEEALFLWLLEKRTSGSHISDAILKTIATKFHAKLEPEKQFIASAGWCRRFKNRFGLKIVDENYNANNDEDMSLVRVAENKYTNNDVATKIENLDHLGNADNDILNNDDTLSYANINDQKNSCCASSDVDDTESKFAPSEECNVTNSHVSLIIEESIIENGEESASSLLALKCTDVLISYSEDHHFPIQDIIQLRKLRDKIEATF